MKKILLITIFLLLQLLHGQTTKVSKFSISLNMSHPTAVGNNFLNKAYSSDLSFGIEGQYNIKNIFVGLCHLPNNQIITDKTIIGNFSTSKSVLNYCFVGYKHQLKSSKKYLEYRFGYGNKTISHKTNFNDYNITGDSWVLGTKFNYMINKYLTVFANLEYHYSSYDIVMGGPYQDFYSTSHEIIPGTGLKFNF